MRTVNTVRNKPKPSKIQQQVTINKIQQSGTVTPTSPTTNAVTTHTTRNAHATPIPVKTTPQVTSINTSSISSNKIGLGAYNTAAADADIIIPTPQVTSINTEPQLTPLGRVGLGIYNTGSDYANILNTDYEDKSILNQAIGHAFEGKWDKAGQVIQNNPYRFAGNLAVEAGSALIPIGMILRGAKIGSTLGKVVSKIKPNKGGGELKEMYHGGRYTLKEITGAEKLIKEQGVKNKLTQTDIDRIVDSVLETKDVVKKGSFAAPSRQLVRGSKFSHQDIIPMKQPSKSVKDERISVILGLVARSKVGIKPFPLMHFERGLFKRSRKSEFEKNQLKRESGPNESNLGALKDGGFRKSLRYGRSDRKKDHVFEQSYDHDMAKKWAGLGLGLGGAGVIGGVGLSETDSKKNKDKSIGGYGQFL